MAKILADHDIKKLIGSVIVDADDRYINPNGIELRLGEHVHFYSTGDRGKRNSLMALASKILRFSSSLISNCSTARMLTSVCLMPAWLSIGASVPNNKRSAPKNL